ncbi:MAG: DUF1449 domain-containing protein [Nocardiopsaceae bacterium]|nr:DUF1449 domain-containing protein [Nocardiopsaceae bacterium]
MVEFFGAVLGFPAGLFSFMLLVVIGYWVFVILGAVDTDLLDTDVDTGTGGFGAFFPGIGLGGVPVTVVLSLLIAVAWFASLVGTVLIDSLGVDSTPLLIALGLLVLAAAVIVAWAFTSGVVMGLRRFLPNQRGSSRKDFVGQTCIVRTGRVDREFGQAEITSADGSSAIIQVRQTGDEDLTSGSTALIFDYDAEGEFFWVTAFDAALDPGLS